MTAAAGAADSPRVAVVIPCFNDGEWIDDALGSLVAQEPVELVVVDDGSTGVRTAAVMERLHERGVRVIRQDNQGVAAARMAGVRATRAPFVLPLDADDQILPGTVAALADALERDPDLGLVWGDTELFGVTRRRRAVKGKVLCPWRITFMNELPGAGGVLIRRSALLAAGGWSLRDGFEDWDLWMAFAERGIPGRRIDRVCQRYRIHPGRMRDALSRSYDERHADLRARHPSLWEQRLGTRGAARASRPLVAAWTAVERMRWLPHLRRTQLMLVALWLCEPSRITRPLR